MHWKIYLWTEIYICALENLFVQWKTYLCTENIFVLWKIYLWTGKYLCTEKHLCTVVHWKIYFLLYKHQWNTKWTFPRKLHIFTREDNMLSSHEKRSPSLWLHNKSRLWKQAGLVFHWCLYNKQNITYSLMDMNFIFSCSTRYLDVELTTRR